MCRRKLNSVFMFAHRCNWGAGEGSFFSSSCPDGDQPVSLRDTAVSHMTLQAVGNIMFTNMSLRLTQLLKASSDWPPLVRCRGRSARRRVPAASTELLQLPENPTRPSPPSGGDPGNTRHMNVPAALANLDLFLSDIICYMPVCKVQLKRMNSFFAHNYSSASVSQCTNKGLR